MSLSRYCPDDAALQHVVDYVAAFKEHDRVVAPTVDQLRTMVQVVFAASLQRDEQRPVRPRLALLPHSRGAFAVRLKGPAELTIDNVARLSSALTGYAALAMSFEGEAAGIWGIVRFPGDAVVVEAQDPGVVGVHRLRPIAFFRAEGEQILEDGSDPSVVTTLMDHALRPLPTDDQVEGSPRARRRQDAVLQICASISAMRHGGAILVVPKIGAWREHLDLPYESDPPYSPLSSAIDKALRAQQKANQSEDGDIPPEDFDFWREGGADFYWRNYDRACLDVAGLASVDGAVVLDERLDVLAFGAKIRPTSNLERVDTWQPLVGSALIDTLISDLGGTRHQSAARFVDAVPGSLAVVASSDGPTSLMGRHPKTGRVTVVRNVELAMRMLGVRRIERP